MSTDHRKLDAFESVFRSAVKDVFHYVPPALAHVLLATDLPAPGAAALADRARHMLRAADPEGRLRWTVLSGADWADATHPIPRLLEIVTEQAPDLVVTYRRLLGRDRELPHTVGAALDVLTQATPIPVLVLPAPEREDLAALLRGTERVLVVTDHLTGSDRLTSWGVRLCAPGGKLYLAHIEDDAILGRYLDTIDKIPEIDSAVARQKLPEKLLSLPRDYIGSTAAALRAQGIDEEVVPVVRLGHAVRDYQALVEEFDIDLMVLDTKDARQDAMSAMAHALSVQIRHRPLLLL